MVIGASGAAKAFVFARDEDGGFPPTATMVINGYTGESYFGHSVAISSTEMVIGAFVAAKAFVFARDEDGGFPATATMVIDGYTGES